MMDNNTLIGYLFDYLLIKQLQQQFHYINKNIKIKEIYGHINGMVKLYVSFIQQYSNMVLFLFFSKLFS
jgi:hypothetical protein